MKNDMKLIMENWRRNTLEEEEVLDEGILQKIKQFFTGKDPFEGDYGSFKQDANYGPKTYGAFVQGAGVVSTLKAANQMANARTINAAAETVAGVGSGKVGGAVSLGLALVGLIPGFQALGLLGVGTAVYSLAKMFRKNPKLADKYPQLTMWRLDPKYEEILDDDLETELLKLYQEYFIEKVRTDPNRRMKSLDKFVTQRLRNLKNGRTVVKFDPGE
jgi:hypothetical protein